MKTTTNKMEGGRIGWMTGTEPTMSADALADYEMQKQACIDLDYVGYQTDYKPLGENEGRVGYLHVCKDGEELQKPAFEIGTYEDGTFIPQAN